MATFPPTVAPQGSADGPPPTGGAPAGGGTPQMKLAMLSQLIQGLAKQFPGSDQGVKMMLDGLKMVQASASAASAPAQPTAPPR